MKLLQTDTPAQAQAKLLEAFGAHPVQRELVPLASCTGRILAEDIRAGEDIPGFFRSTVDGYAVRAKDTIKIADRDGFAVAQSGPLGTDGEDIF